MDFTGFPCLCSRGKEVLGENRLGLATGGGDQWMGTLYRVVGNFLGSGVALWAAASNSSRRQEGPEPVEGATVLWDD